MDYKLTINLPKTNFPMQAKLKETEIKIMNYWKNIQNKKEKTKKIFILNDGPPYANGDIHMGHAFNKVLKDIICKFKKLNGYDISFIPGWDCHGLPIELNVEKKIKNINNIISDYDFRQICRSYATSQIKMQKKSFTRLGIHADWENPYKTMNNLFEAEIIKSFKTMLENKNIYLGYKPIYWCFDCSSALAESEIEYYIKKSFSLYITFKLIEKKLLEKYKEINLIIWTTTPWTIPFNEAVALNKNLYYILFNYKKKTYIVNKDVYYNIKIKIKKCKIKIEKIIKGNFIKNSYLIHPIYKKKIKIIFSEHVKNDSGTGCVHIAPAYGYDDYKLGLKYNIYIKNQINEIGYLNKKVKFFKKNFFLNINKNIIIFLKKTKKLFLKELIYHKYPYCWRHKTVLIFRTTKQWFFNINNRKLKNNILKLSNNVIKWTPKIGSTKIKNMIKNRLDWCISRQRVWGVPIMLLNSKNNNKIHENSIKLIEKSIDITKKEGSDFWYKRKSINKFKIDKKKYEQNIDVLDVWFDSSVVYSYISNEKKYKLPMNICIEGSDQYRGWFQVSLINSVSNKNKIPYKNIITHGFILDEDGKKMSKSLNNIISPNNIVEKYGAEIFRLWTSSVNYQFDVNFSEETINRICEAYRKIRNTLRFMLSNTEKIKIEKNTNFLKLDKWILYKLFTLKKKIKKENKKFKLFTIYKNIYNFCIEELCSKYFEIIKDKLYTENEKKSSEITLFSILYTIIKLISPILSFTAEEAWINLNYKESESVFLSNLKINLKIIKNIKFKIREIIHVDKIFDLKNIVNKKISENKEKKINNNLELNIKIYSNIFWYYIAEKAKNEIYKFLIVSKFNIKKTNEINKNLKIKLYKTKKIKCERCWNRHVKIQSKIRICKKCVNVLYYNEENINKSFI